MTSADVHAVLDRRNAEVRHAVEAAGDVDVALSGLDLHRRDVHGHHGGGAGALEARADDVLGKPARKGMAVPGCACSPIISTAPRMTPSTSAAATPVRSRTARRTDTARSSDRTCRKTPRRGVGATERGARESREDYLAEAGHDWGLYGSYFPRAITRALLGTCPATLVRRRESNLAFLHDGAELQDFPRGSLGNPSGNHRDGVPLRRGLLAQFLLDPPAMLRGRGSARRLLVGFVLVMGVARPTLALHKETPHGSLISKGASHDHPVTRSWGDYFAFISPTDLTSVGSVGRQVYVFSLSTSPARRAVPTSVRSPRPRRPAATSRRVPKSRSRSTARRPRPPPTTTSRIRA